MCEVGECAQGPHNTWSIVLGVAFPDYANQLMNACKK